MRMRILVRTVGRLALAVAIFVVLGNVFGIVLIALGVGHPT
jgi:hypothetical protein